MVTSVTVIRLLCCPMSVQSGFTHCALGCLPDGMVWYGKCQFI